jgi:2-polyprenyl-3-methyl-5-hydroxy-6-metoxy-1,4-benzoquinol methylase
MSARRRHWESIYRTKGEDELSWHQDEPTLSLSLIRDVASPGSRILDVGGGTSPLAARLSDHGFRKVTVLDIAGAAVRLSQSRSGAHLRGVHWLREDVTKVDRLPKFDVWHDRAVFHFLTDPRDRRAYVALAERTIPVGGSVILATFALDGPERCSGLEVVRYNGRKLGAEFSNGFSLLRELREVHRTPWGTLQPFTYVVLQRVRGASRRSTKSLRPG